MFVIVLVIHRLLLEPTHAAYELLHTVRSMDDAICFVEVGEVTLDFVPDRALSMLFLEVTLMSQRLTCLFKLDTRLEVSVYEECCLCALVKLRKER